MVLFVSVIIGMIHDFLLQFLPSLTTDLRPQISEVHCSATGSHWAGEVLAVWWQSHCYWIKWLHHQVQCGDGGMVEGGTIQSVTVEDVAGDSGVDVDVMVEG